jgi:hypothetical protein
MVTYSRRVLAVATLALFSGFGASAQSVISTHSGVLHVSEGAVFADDQAVNQKYGTFPDLKQNSVLRTEQGRAEILLTPGVFLRVGENSAVKMVDNRLSDTRVEILKGTAVVECDDPMKVNSITMLVGDYQVHVRKSSVMEFVSSPAELKVIHGEAEVELNGQISVVHAGKALPFTQALAQEKFDAKADSDDLTRWSEERSQAVSVANVSAAKSLMDSGGMMPGMMGTGLYSNGMMPYGSWYYNPFYSMYTYMPMNGMFYNPYGYGIFSPYTVYQVYNNPGYFTSSGKSSTGTSTSSGNRPHVGLSSVNSSRAIGGNGFNSRATSVSSSTGTSTLSPTFSAPMSGMGSSTGMAGTGASSVAGRGGARGK